MTMRINIVKDNNFDLPRYATLQSAGCDLQAVCPEGGILVAARDSAVIGTGIHIALPAGYEAQELDATEREEGGFGHTGR